MVGWFRRFIQNYAHLCEPLTVLLRKKVRWRWAEQQEESFSALNSCLLSPPILSCPNYEFPFVVQADASAYAIGGALTQDYGDGDRVIMYLSRALSQQERNMSATEREALAVIYCLEKFRPYIEGLHVQVITDHFSLIWLLNLKNPTGRLARWLSRVQQFEFTLVHRKGKLHDLPDALSRIEALDADGVEILDFSDTKDRKFLSLFRKVSGAPDSYKGYNVSNGRLYKQVLNRNGEVMWKLLVPSDKIQSVLRHCHDEPTSAHFCARKTFSQVFQFYVWRCMTRDVRNYVRKCRTCQKFKSVQRRPAGLMR
ncbi:hypothetical protein B566_EDAN019512 [Ephemera danica]|nr:hypothetical protein B566_EDAN019512 [Ephemera danica]